MPTTVRDAAFDVLRRYGATTLFANPGSTEIALLTDLPADLEFVLALHEGSVVGMATGWALAHDRPAVAILHTTAGLGNAVGALATARVNRAPLVVLVGQQDRRHLALEPFLAGHRLDDVAAPAPVWVGEPPRPQDVPGALARAWHEARDHRGPALVIVPMDDWLAPAELDEPLPAPARLLRTTAAEPEVVAELEKFLVGAEKPVLVVGAGADDADSWHALEALAERLRCPVWQEAFGARAGFPQDHPQFAGHLPAGRAELRKVLAGHDAVLAVGAPVFRQYPREPGRLIGAGTRVAVVTDDPGEAHRSPADLAVLARPAAVCGPLARRLPARPAPAETLGRTIDLPEPPAAGARPAPEHVFAALARRLPRDAVLVEETPSSRPLLHALVPARAPLGFLSAAMGGLGFGVPAAIGVRMARPDRPVVAVVGDGSSLYAIQALWSAAHYGVGVLVVVLANGRYAIMDQLAARHGEASAGRGAPPWPTFDEVSVSGLARSLGCPARRVTTCEELESVLDEVLPVPAGRTEPLVLDVEVVS
ncbi:thiamine pyrophosphate-dependent enzyme [Amycolatopsis sp. FDAARGOS 1241]|uniref:thiamine pyrophosphate-dependent enzyme n=1 Tax=Amycolatopsis sp. FDAARGOS 1241 TaxID=2778070 RepID=UPI00194ED61F|nr:thiamine pyrophosphate-dependent enzyme [Amycolatopsis sp. FDAARGOS 1241]QRP49348.1 thiamine pyrophosphate-binding protein [Amycolatopsis sp. FDAARGOS 1241]